MEEKNFARYHFIKLIVYLIIGVSVIVFRETLIDYLKYLIGGLLILYSAEEITFDVIFFREHIFHREKIYLGIVEFILGVVLLAFDHEFTSCCIVWATWSIVRESYEIKDIMCELKALGSRIISGVESLVIIGFSISLILHPTEHHAMIHMYLILLELVCTPLVYLNEELLMRKKEHKENNE